MEDEDFLAEIGKDDDAATIEQPAEPVVETPAEVAPEPVAVEPAPEPAKPEPGFVPFAAVLDERDKRKELQAEIERMRQAQPAAQPQPIPDMFEDPEGYTSALAQTFEQRIYQTQLQMSDRFAQNQYGEELTTAAKQWAFEKCNQDPHFNAKVRESGDPVGYAVKEYQRDQIASNVTQDDFTQFMAWKQAQAGLTPAPTPSDNPSPAKPPPRSLASAPSAGPAATEPVQSDEEIFAETFARK
ncbi:hypothetical protein [Sphingopyxis witflariensis]|uniref:Uncharacterized protein n=1 Tax=Sphingopyxis witflariensis TaxID=173675 RepID=A0A246JY35_9SPHN|nr:hypothetical protein [Sphingopyxis witflariensis]OWQ98013.1 hypothetical protein CDQ91_10360 [Sphingopyxis witflariensis]